MKLTRDLIRERSAQAAPRQLSGMRKAGLGIGLGLALGFGVPMVESMARPAHAEQARPAYSPKTNPFRLDARMKLLLAKFNSGTAREKVQGLHSSLSGSVSAMGMEGLPPRTGAEALAKGGDCTDLANIAIPLLRKMGLSGGAMVVHFKSAPAEEDHMVPFVNLGGKRVIVDLQNPTLGKTAQGEYTIRVSLTFDQSASMYHREWGDYLKSKGRAKEAIRAYKRSLRIFEGDAYVHQHLGELYEDHGNKVAATKHWKRAAQLDPSYSKHGKRASYNDSVRLGYEAYKARRFADCARHFRAALESGEGISPAERAGLQKNIDICSRRAR
jgi:tetratricopeptide (TPR) repeat protein